MIYLVALTYLVIIILFYFGYRKKYHLLKNYFDNKNFISNRNYEVLYLVALAIIILFLLYQVFFNRRNENSVFTNKNDTEIFIALDISQSMSAEDVKPDRFTLAKNKAIELIESNPYASYGLILFSENAFVAYPLTKDSDAIKRYLKDLNKFVITDMGTNFNELLKVENFPFSDNSKKEIYIFSDGENNITGLNESNLEKFVESKIKIFTVGIGNETGDVVLDREKEFREPLRIGKDVIQSKLNKDFLEKISSKTNAKYFDISQQYNIFNMQIKKNININNSQRKTSDIVLFLLIGVLISIIIKT